jgi:hypothetical protein
VNKLDLMSVSLFIGTYSLVWLAYWGLIHYV